MKKLYLKLLQHLCQKELKKISDVYPNTMDEIIKWHDFMAIECINAETKGEKRVLGICVGTSNLLEMYKAGDRLEAAVNAFEIKHKKGEMNP